MTNDRYYGGLPHSSKTSQRTTVKDLADGLEQAARVMGKGAKSDVTANLAWAIRKGDKRHVQKLLDKHIDDIIGGQGTVNEIMRWLNGQIPEGREVTMRSLIQRLEEATVQLSNSAWKAAHAELQDLFTDNEAERVIGLYKRYAKDKAGFAKAAVNAEIGTRDHKFVHERDWLDIWASLDKVA